jgi:hypothetical protein
MKLDFGEVSSLIKLAESTFFSASRESCLPSTIHPQPSTISPARGRAEEGRGVKTSIFRTPVLCLGKEQTKVRAEKTETML